MIQEEPEIEETDEWGRFYPHLFDSLGKFIGTGKRKRRKRTADIEIEGEVGGRPSDSDWGNWSGKGGS